MKAEVVAALVGFLLILTSFMGAVKPTYATCVQVHWGDCIFTWGYSNPNKIGWLVPANTTLYTTFVTNATIVGWVEGLVTIFPLQYDSSTRTIVGLYVNGEFIDSAPNWVAGHGGTCTNGVCESRLLKLLTPDLAVFSDYTMQFGLYHVVGLSSIPSGSTVTLAFEADTPLWVSINNQTSGSSYEQAHHSYTSLPATLVEEGSLSPHTVAVWVYSTNPGAPGGPGVFPLLLWDLVGLAVVSMVIGTIVFVVASRNRRKRVRESTSVCQAKLHS